MNMLNEYSIMILSMVNKTFYELYKSEKFWRFRIIENFGSNYLPENYILDENHIEPPYLIYSNVIMMRINGFIPCITNIGTQSKYKINYYLLLYDQPKLKDDLYNIALQDICKLLFFNIHDININDNALFKTIFITLPDTIFGKIKCQYYLWKNDPNLLEYYFKLGHHPNKNIANKKLMNIHKNIETRKSWHINKYKIPYNHIKRKKRFNDQVRCK